MIARRHLWILLLALLLPLAQAAIAAHEVSHVQATLETGSKSAPPGGHCDMCAVAAQIGGGGAPSSPAKVHVPDLRQSAPVCQLTGQFPIGVVTGFDSRAPPDSLLF